MNTIEIGIDIMNTNDKNKVNQGYETNVSFTCIPYVIKSVIYERISWQKIEFIITTLELLFELLP